MYESGVGPARLGTDCCVSQPRGPWSGRWGKTWSGCWRYYRGKPSNSVIGPQGENVSPASTSLTLSFSKIKQTRVREEEGTGGSGDSLHRNGNGGEFEGRRAGHLVAFVEFGAPRGRGKRGSTVGPVEHAHRSAGMCRGTEGRGDRLDRTGQRRVPQ